ncbi:molybdopterin-binding protein [Tropicimonas sp. S265A]|uniref:molybdopterin-binding protein n=1 Tax=Tropicimonas sp. S265A TaxID=3415134 RepID=UPI003C7DF884
MKFGPVPLDEAEGALLAHSAQLPSGKISKGTVLTAAHLAEMAANGTTEVIVARLGPHDMDENAAAAQIAQALVPAPGKSGLRVTEAFTGRVNLVAEAPGIVEINTRAIEALNSVDPMITLATVPQYARVSPGMLVGTVKIIAYGVGVAAVARAAEAGRAGVRIRPAAHQTAGLVLTEVSEADTRLRAKSVDAIEARLTQLGMRLSETRVTAHRTAEVGAALAGIDGDMVLLLTASATSDPDDVGPAGVRAAGGAVTRFGMPVDPGNLLFLGRIGARPVIGLPGCARSPALNGADWVLERVACGVPVSGADIAAMGVGGLLKEIPSRPQPRRGKPGS